MRPIPAPMTLSSRFIWGPPSLARGRWVSAAHPSGRLVRSVAFSLRTRTDCANTTRGPTRSRPHPVPRAGGRPLERDGREPRGRSRRSSLCMRGRAACRCLRIPFELARSGEGASLRYEDYASGSGRRPSPEAVLTQVNQNRAAGVDTRVGGSNPSRRANLSKVHTGHMVYRLFRRHR